MGLQDRHYYRAEPPRGGGFSARPSLSGWSVNTWLIVINTAIFLLGALVPAVGGFLFNYGHFSTAEAFFFVRGNAIVLSMEVWRLLTFQFLHAHFLHLFFNMFGLFIFGGMVEQYLGRKRYLAFYLTCGIFGAVAYLVLNLIGQTGLQIPGGLGNDPHTPLIGASAGVFGVILAAAYLAPNAVLQLLIPPVPLRLKTFAYIYVGIAFLNLLMGGANAGGDAAHLGGAAAGAILIRNAHLLRDFFDVFKDSRRRPRANPGRVAGSSRREEREVDRILSKVATEGLQSLTEAEKRVLRRASENREAS